jgi:RTX calcium-binding nonapeptide repeat (4 copies)
MCSGTAGVWPPALEAGALYAAIATLPDDFCDALVAVDVARLSYKEAVRALRIQGGTLMSGNDSLFGGPGLDILDGGSGNTIVVQG